MPRAAPPQEPTDTAVYWFVKLELAVEASDFKAAAEAQAQLERLGVTVRYVRTERHPPTTFPKLHEVPHVGR